MERYDVIIVGGGPGGLTAALSAKNAYPKKKVLLIRREPTALIPCGIPYIFHSLAKIEDDILPNAPLEKNGIDYWIDTVVDVQGKKAILASGKEVEFDKLILATGSTPAVPPIAGLDKKGVYFIKKDMEYLRGVKAALQKAQRVVIIGGGFIGVEVADELLKAGKSLILVERLEHLLPFSLDPEFSEMLEDDLRARGVELHLGISVQEVMGEGKAESVLLTDGTKIACDAVIVSAGYRPNVELAQKMGLEVDPHYGIIIDEYMRTSMKDVFAVGDCAAKRHFMTGDYSNVMLASTAMAQGRLVGSNLFDVKVIKSCMGSLGTFSTKVGDLAFGVTGMTETQAKALGVDYVVGRSAAVDRHPGKLPGVSKVEMKLIYARYSHVLLGAQVKGGDSVGELINMLAVMIQNHMTDMEIDTLQIGTHPLLTASPIVYPVITATVNAIMQWYPHEC